MPFWGNLASRITGGIWPRWGGHGQGSKVRLLLPGSRYDYEIEAGNLWRNSTTAILVQWMADRLPRPALQVCRIQAKSGEFDPLPSHPLVDLWHKPNPYYTRRTLEAAVGLSLVVDGNAHIQVVGTAAGKPLELWWLPFHQCTPLWPTDGSEFLSGWEVDTGEAQYQLTRDEVIHLRRGIDPNNVRLGMAALKSCLREVCTDNEASVFGAALLRNAGVGGLMVVPDSDMLRPNPNDAKDIKEKVNQAISGENRGSTVVLGGPYRVQQVGFSPEQMALDKFPQLPMAKIAAACGIPLMAAGLPDPGKTYSNLAEALRIAWSTVYGVQELIAESLRWELLPRFGTDPKTHTVTYDYSNVPEMNEDEALLHTRVREDFKAGITQLNEARDLIGLEPDPDGDRFYPGTGSASDEAMKPDPMANGNPLPARNGNGKGWY